jgi:CRISPR-associated protein Cmr6
MNRQYQQGKRGGQPRADTPTKRPERLPFPSPALRLEQCRNPGLVFDRYVRFQDDWQLGEYATDPRGKKKRGAKLYNLEEVKATQDRCNKDNEWQVLHADFVRRWWETVNAQGAEPFTMTPDWRFVTGLGDKTALEVGFTFHRLYGFPMIPGSGLKGLARMAAMFEIAERLSVKGLGLQATVELVKPKDPKAKSKPTPFQKLEAFLLANDERVKSVVDSETWKQLQRKEQQAWAHLDLGRALLDQEQAMVALFRRIFGAPHAEGEAVFFDAVPEAPPVLEVDVMNPHFPEYYQGEQFPADWQSPKPVFFLTVGRTPFWFAVGRRGRAEPKLQQQAMDWLKYGLTKLGAGAKTSAGYGYFEETHR